jgi:predicted dehydrogenase
MFGPVRRVHAYGTVLEPDRVARDGARFRLAVPDLVVAALELDGVVVRLTASFWVGPNRQRGLELHGSDATLFLASWAEHDSRLERSVDGERYEPVPLLREPYHGIDWSRPLVDLAESLAEGRPHRASAEHAAHVVEVLDAVRAAAEGGGAVDVRSEFAAPEPAEWAR